MIALTCLAFWIFGIAVGAWGSWLIRQLREDADELPLLCRWNMHRWGITTYPIGTRWCKRCRKKDHDASGYDPAMITLLTRSIPTTAGEGERGEGC